MKNILALIIFVVVFGGVIVFAIVSAIRRREISFEGSVIDKDVVENRSVNNMPNQGSGFSVGNMNGGVTHEYKIKVKTDEGKEINYKITEGMYEVIKIGDRVSKPHGTTEITILSSQQSGPAQPMAQTQSPPAPQAPTPISPMPSTPTAPTVNPTQNNDPKL